MTLWIDADACPRPVRDVTVKAARRKQIELVLVANSAQQLPPGPGVRQVIVASGVTADIPLAAGLVDRGVTAINPRGQIYDKGSIGERLAVRNLMDELRGAGLAGRSGPPPYSDKDKQAFANALDRLIARLS